MKTNFRQHEIGSISRMEDGARRGGDPGANSIENEVTKNGICKKFLHSKRKNIDFSHLSKRELPIYP